MSFFFFPRHGALTSEYRLACSAAHVGPRLSCPSCRQPSEVTLHDARIRCEKCHQGCMSGCSSPISSIRDERIPLGGGLKEWEMILGWFVHICRHQNNPNRASRYQLRPVGNESMFMVRVRTVPGGCYMRLSVLSSSTAFSAGYSTDRRHHPYMHFRYSAFCFFSSEPQACVHSFIAQKQSPLQASTRKACPR